MQLFSLLWGVWDSPSSSSFISVLEYTHLSTSARPTYQIIFSCNHSSLQYQSRSVGLLSLVLSLSLTPVCFSFPLCSAAISLSCAFSMTYHNYRATFQLSIFQLLFHFFFWYRQWCKRYKCFSLLLAEVSVSCLWRKVWLNRLVVHWAKSCDYSWAFCPAKNFHNASLRHFNVENKLFLRQTQHHSYVYVMVLKKRIPWMHFDWTASTKCISVMDC